MDDYYESNRRNWDERARVHPETDYYDVAGFLDGESSLWPLEREELGPHVDEGTSLLHLQCHFGMDTLSWAREGAEVVGVDFSGEAVREARILADEAGLADRAEFVESDVLGLDLDREFDVVFTSYGVLAWLDDLAAWADTVDRHLAPGGVFYIAENHPVAGTFASVEGDSAELAYPYFSDEPLHFDVQGSYAADAEFEHSEHYEWAHTLGDIVTELATRGLRIEFLHEHPFCTWRCYEGMTEDEQGYWWLPEDVAVELPLTFSLKARKE
ncbi:class I SAM-dependent methyltransferase [Haloarchaeobius amylolyticus]|uniref:class I SAM-dependent methyltransferase n=1 Tax=Haloarchaeobius amylolyticus TaxID=1198296 RepID=UPI00226F704A|nr:class I SAM-dependent methyltransferase [Haloarchaeobius amylolyticus]